jgi:hypothetical protein
MPFYVDPNKAQAIARIAAQLGASFLRLLGAIIFNPRTAPVWLERAGEPLGTAN